jgi:uncharacterized membrane protein YphA (DoxX/SURF4 family)
MTKRNKIIYWIATIWLALGMLAGGLQQIFHTKAFIDINVHLGYPLYFLYILGTWKILGVIAILIPRFGLLKEWAYAGFFFAMSGAAFSHIASGDSIGEIAPSLALLILTVVSWYFRPEDRKISSGVAERGDRIKSMISSEYVEMQREFGQRNSLFAAKMPEIQEMIFFFRDALEESVNADDGLEIYTFFRQSIESFNSILILSANGFARNALQLLRTMFEDCVTMRYLVKLQANPVEATESKPYPDSINKFRDFFYINLIKHFQFGRKHFPDIISEDDLNNVKAKRDAVVKQFTVSDCKECSTKKVEHKWGLDLISMARAVNLELLVLECYYEPLTLCHPSANGIDHRWVGTEDVIEYQFESLRAEQKVLRNAHYLLLLSMETASKHFAVNDEKGIWARNMTNWDEVWKIT